MTWVGEVCNKLMGPCVHRSPSKNITSRPVYLTFDDGPHPNCTEQVLKVLNRLQVKATFFLVANRAARYPTLTQEIVSEGHSIGNHSLDHNYKNHFKTQEQTLHWVHQSQELLFSLTSSEPIGFRAPAGVRTPWLHKALDELGINLIHWDIRFFDNQIPWTMNRASKSLSSIQNGSIVLLHDAHEGKRQKIFLETLEDYLITLKTVGFHPLRIEKTPKLTFLK